jgi:hypothetical protein
MADERRYAATATKSPRQRTIAATTSKTAGAGVRWARTKAARSSWFPMVSALPTRLMSKASFVK